MGKKKNLQKRHKFKHVEAAQAISGQIVDPSNADKVQSNAPAKPGANAAVRQNATAGGGRAAASVRDFSYVTTDLKRIGIMAASLIALELALYYVLVHTPLGTSIYSLVKV